MSDRAENWRPVPGWEEFYEVSDCGRVKSLSRTTTCVGRWGKSVSRIEPERILKPAAAGGGYLFIGLRLKGVSKPAYIHRLVLEAFIGPCPKGQEACHNNGERTDNRLGNLRWDTRKNNHADKRRHGTVLRGEESPNSVLSNREAHALRVLGNTGVSTLDLAVAFQVSQSHVRAIRAGTQRKVL